MAVIAVLGTLETNGDYHQFLADCISQHGHRAILVDVGIAGSPKLNPHISREHVSGLGDLDWRVFRKNPDQGVSMMMEAAPNLLLKLLSKKKIHGVVSLGRGGETAIGMSALRALPVGFPKLLVTLDGGNTNPPIHFLDDLAHLPCTLDVGGLNRLTRPQLARAAGAICGMVEAARLHLEESKPVIFASVFGNTTTGVEHASKLLRESEFDVLCFNATGTGGRIMEKLLNAHMAAGVLEYTPTEWADEVVGGVLSAGPTRLEAAARNGVPAVFAPGCLDLVNFFAQQTVPEKFAERTMHRHNANITLMRTTVDEAQAIARAVAGKLNLSTGPLTVVFPLKGTSALSAPGYAFHDPKADLALLRTLRKSLRPDIPILEVQATVNDPEFAETCAAELLKNIKAKEAADAARPY